MVSEIRQTQIPHNYVKLFKKSNKKQTNKNRLTKNCWLPEWMVGMDEKGKGNSH